MYVFLYERMRINGSNCWTVFHRPPVTARGQQFTDHQPTAHVHTVIPSMETGRGDVFDIIYWQLVCLVLEK